MSGGAGGAPALGARGRASSARRSRSPPTGSRSRSPPPSSASRPTGAPPSRPLPPRAAASGRCAASSACGRGSSASTSRRRSASYDAAVRYKLAQIADAIDRKGVDAKARARGARHPGRRGHDRAGSSTAMRPPRPSSRRSATFDRGSAGRAAARDDRAEGEERRPRRCGDAGAHRALGADPAAPTARRAGGCRAGGSRRCSRCPPGAAPTVSISGRGAEKYLERLSAAVSRKPQDAHFQVTATGEDRDPALGARASARRPGDREGDRGGRVLGRTTGRRTSSSGSPSPKRTTEIAKTMGIDERRLVATRRPTAARRGGSTTCSSSRS